MEQKAPVIVALNMWDDTKHHGIHINVGWLEEWLGVPVVATTAVTGEGFARLIDRLTEARTPRVRTHSLEERWQDIGNIISKAQRLEHRHHTTWERLQDLTIKPKTGIPFAMLAAFIAFKFVRFIGEGLIRYLADPFFENLWKPLLMQLSALLGNGGIIHDVLVGKLINGHIDYVQSFGVLSTASGCTVSRSSRHCWRLAVMCRGYWLPGRWRANGKDLSPRPLFLSAFPARRCRP